MKVAFLSNVPDGGTFKLGSHHLAREMSRRGHTVAHVSTPVSRFEEVIGRDVRGRRFWAAPALSAEKLRTSKSGAHLDEFGVLHSSPRPLLPARWWPSQPAVKRHLDGIDFADADVVVLDQLLLEPATADVSRLVYRPTDNLPAGVARDVERTLVQRVSAIVAPSPFTLDAVVPPALTVPTLLLENGVDSRFFSSTIGARSGAVYVGAVDYRFGWSQVIAAAEALPDTDFTIAGPVASSDVPPALPKNVHLVGPIRYDDVPALLWGSKVGLLPLSEAQTNKGRSPMKYFEYLAAGLYVVATDTPTLSQRRQIDGVALTANPEEFAESVKALVSRGEPNTDGVRVAREYEWEHRARIFERFLLDWVLP